VIRVWDVGTGIGRELVTLASPGSRLRWSSDGRWLAVTEGYEVLDVIDVTEARVTCAFRGHDESASDFTPDGKTIVYTERSSVQLGDPVTCTSHTLWEHKGKIYNLAFTRGGKIASASTDATVALGSLAGGEPQRLSGHTAGVYTVAFAPDGETLASGDFVGSMRTWDVATGEARTAVRADGRMVLYVGFLNNGTLISAGADDAVRLWDRATGELLHEERGTGAGGFAVLPDGLWLVSAGPAGLRMWAPSVREPLPQDPAALRTWMIGATSARIDEEHRVGTP
jgi:WD40 repeat protein